MAVVIPPQHHPLTMPRQARRKRTRSPSPATETVVSPPPPPPPLSESYFIKKVTRDMAYLQQKYGFQPVLAMPQLSAEEMGIFSKISELIKLIDEHKAYWIPTTARQTLAALSDASACAHALLGAITSQDRRLERTVAAIYQRNLAQLVRAIRSPVVNANNRAVAEPMRQRALRDRGLIKDLLRDIVQGLYKLCVADIEPAFQRIMDAPRPAIQQWLNQQVAVVNALQVDAQLVNEDDVAANAPAPPPAGIYN